MIPNQFPTPVPILATKLHIPSQRANAVARKRLLEKLNHGQEKKLCLICAPAGFGKTTLLTTWLKQIPENKYQFSWISLDKHDSDPVRFLTYLISALQASVSKFGPGLLASLNASPNTKFEVITNNLLNEWANSPKPWLVILEDYHEITNSETHQIVDTLIDNAPPHVHFVITSRNIPALSIPRWRVRDQLTEITTADLRFTTAETTLFLNQTMGLSLNEQSITSLEARTEGWAAGLQLAAISLRATKNTDIFIDSFTGRDRQVADYLLTEVLNHQNEDTRQFLLNTSILERFNAALCNSILDHSDDQIADTQQFLEELEATDLFIVPLDNQRYWYRYHQLFGELLHQRLENNQTGQHIANLHRKAARWYQSHDMPDQAVSQALQGKDYEFAAQIIAEMPLHHLWERSMRSQYHEWVNALPPNVIGQFPHVLIGAMWAALITGQIEKLQNFIIQAQEHSGIEPQRKLFQAYIERTKGHVEQALELFQSAGENLPKEETELRIKAATQIANCQIQLGQLTQASDTLEQLRQWMPIRQAVYLNEQLDAIVLQGSVAKLLGEYHRAETFLKEGLALAEGVDTPAPEIGMIYHQLADINYLRNELDKTEMYLEQAALWGKRTGIFDIQLNTAILEADLALAKADYDKAHEAVNLIVQLLSPINQRAVIEIAKALEANYALCFGDLETAVRWANAVSYNLTDKPSFSRFREYFYYISIRLAEYQTFGSTEQLTELISFLDWSIQQSQQVSHNHFLIQGLIYKVMALDQAGETKAAIETLHTALILAQPGNILRLFLDQGQPMQQLLEKALSYGEHLSLIRQLLVAFAEDQSNRGKKAKHPLSQTGLVEALTDREMEVLHLIAAGLSNKSIEEKLVISNNTVRTHIKNIYSKFEVSNRTQAILKARELKILP